MKHHILRVVRIGFGVILIAAGVIGIFLPFVQGLLLIFAGLIVIYGKDAALAIVGTWKKKGMAFFGKKPEP